MNITVIGMGYIGIVNAVVLQLYGHNVIAYDINKDKIELLKQGIALTDEPKLQDLLGEVGKSIRFTSNAYDALTPNSIYVIAVDTPTSKSGSPDLSHFYNVLDEIIKYAKDDSYIIIRSTVPPLTNSKVREYLNSRSEYKFSVLTIPEFLTQSTAIMDELNPSRVVIGAVDKSARELAKKIYADYAKRNIPIVYTTPENAELIKYASNNFLSMKISFINSFAQLCEKVGGNIDEVAYGVGLDPRIGKEFLKAGIGYGGLCFPSDNKTLSWFFKENDTPDDLVEATININDSQIQYFVDKVLSKVKSLNNLHIAVLGLAFKGGAEEVRNSPSIPIIKAFTDKGAFVHAYDPLAIDSFHQAMPRMARVRLFDYLFDAMKDCDFAVILNDSEEFQNLTPQDFKNHLKKPIVFDGRNLYPLDAMKGIEYYSIGRPQLK